MVGWLKALLFVAGGVTAATGTAYVTGLLDSFLGRQPQVIAALPQAQQPATEQVPATAEEAVPLPADEPLVTEKQDRLVVPTFDVLRVEPDGSVLIAGKAAAGATVEVLNGDTVLISTKAEAEGDFVAVLDEPLAPGDYRLALRAISGDVVALSLETAIVSIPEVADGQVLALVEAPGAPAELVTIPQAPSEAAAPPQDTEIASAPQAIEPEVEAGQPQADTREPQADTGQPQADTGEQETVLAETETPEDVAEQEIEATSMPQQPAGQETVQAPAMPETADTPAMPETADTDVASGSDTDSAPPATEEIAEAEVEAEVVPEPEAETVADAEEPASDETELTAVPQETGQPEAAEQPAEIFNVVVEAVEIEGETIFIAGQAAPGRTVRVYANEIVLGDARVSEAGRFLVEERRNLPVGQYTIRADLLDEDGSVLARAAVPFEREAGEAIAAVAPQPPQPPAAAAQESTAQENDVAETGLAEAEAGDEQLTAPALQRVDGSVIIRRGDSLWRISRRVYGRGVRYSTIYLANQDQISDPNRIWPGQVFAVPQETSEGEQADMEAIGDQAVTRDGPSVAQ